MASALLLGVLYAKKDQPLMDQVTTNLVEVERASEAAGE